MNDQGISPTQYPFKATFQQKVANALGLIEDASEDDILLVINELLEIEQAAEQLFDASEELPGGSPDDTKIYAPIDYFEELGWSLTGRVSDTNGEGMVIQ